MSVCLLVKKIKDIKFKKINDLFQVTTLTDSIFEEWVGIKNKYRKKLAGKSKASQLMLAKYEAEEEILLGLICLLNQKIVNSYCASD